MRWSRITADEGAEAWVDLANGFDRLAGVATQGSAASRLRTVLRLLERSSASEGGRASHRHTATGIPTREPLLQRMDADERGVLGLIRFLDFDRLCAFDPSLGDRLLHAVAERLRAMLPEERFLAHVDRAHLAVWFGAQASEASARGEMEAIEYALGAAIEIAGRTVLPKTSSQIFPVENEDPATVLARALAQLTVAIGGNGPKGASQNSGADEREGFAFEQDLRLAMGRGELRLCYQPLIDAAKERVCGAEALMRWQHPRRGAVSPGIFVPVIEATGLAHDFGLWALNTAVRDARRWQDHGFADMRVAVNVSGHQLDRDDFSTLVERTLSRHALKPAALEIELTEGVAMVDCDRAARLFSDVRALGVSIAIDDFGTGYSSLSTLRKLAFDKIKIDREFVTEVDRRKDSQAICLSIVALARGLGIRVLAEGVERPEEYGWLRRHGCNFFQGYYFSPPLEAAAFAAFVENTAALSTKLALDTRALQQDTSERLSA